MFWINNTMDQIKLDLVVEVCIWRLIEDQWIWESGCNQEPTIVDDGPLQLGWRHCPFCGLPLVQRRDEHGV